MGNIFLNGVKKYLPVFSVFIFLSVSGANAISFFLFPQQTKKKEITYDISVSAISIAVTVQDRRGRFITDLAQEDFAIYENNEKKDITYFSQDYEAPLSLTILLDVSGSMVLQDKLKESKEALDYLLKYLLDDQDEVSLLIFADGEVEVAANFTRDKNEFLTVLGRTEAYGQTALNDAVAVSPEFANKGSYEKRALLLITDGIENDSQYSPDQAIEVARRVDIPIYTIGYKIPLSEQYLEKYKHSQGLTALNIVESLEKFSAATGGKAFFLDQVLDLKNALRLIKQELSHQYILGYTSYTDPENAYRKIKVVTPKKNYRVRTREGYYSGEKKHLQNRDRRSRALGSVFSPVGFYTPFPHRSSRRLWNSALLLQPLAVNLCYSNSHSLCTIVLNTSSPSDSVRSPRGTIRKG